MTEPHQLTIAQAATEIAARRLTSQKLVEDLLSRIDKLDSRLKAWVTVDAEGALESAQALDRELEERGPRSPLHGIPLGIKDIYYTAGLKTTACSKILADFTPSYDAASVARLREAGAIILGKTVTTEFASGDPPPTLNPWRAAHTPEVPAAAPQWQWPPGCALGLWVRKRAGRYFAPPPTTASLASSPPSDASAVLASSPWHGL